MKALVFGVFSLLLMAPVQGRAGILITFDYPNQTGNAGDVLTFTGVIQNLDLSNEVFLNNVALSLNGSDFTDDAFDSFLANVPWSLGAGETSSNIQFFTVSIANPYTAPAGQFFGTYTLFGGADGGAGDFLGQADISVDNSPEPGSAMMFGGGILLVALSRRLRKR